MEAGLTIDQILRTSTIVTALNIFSRGIGLLVPILIAALFGVSRQADAYYLASIIPLFLVQVLGVALSAVFVPVLVEQRVQSPDAVSETVGATAVFLLLFSLAAILLLAIFIPWLFPLLTKGVPQATVKLAIQLIVAMLPLLLLSTLVGLMSAILNTYKKFIGPVLAPGIRGAVLIGVALISYRQWGIYAIVIGMLIGELVTLLVLTGLVYAEGVRFKLTWTMPRTVKKTMRLALPMIIGIVVLLLNPIIDRLMAAPLGEGSVSTLTYAGRVMMIPVALLSAGFFVVLLTHWSEIVAQGNLDELHTQLKKSVRVVLFIILPISIYLFMMRVPVIRLLFGRGAFTEDAVVATADLLGILALGLVPYMLLITLNRVYLATQHTKTPMFLALTNVFTNFVLNILLISLWGLAGIALSTTITYFGVFLLASVILRKRLQFRWWQGMWRPAGKMAAVSLLFVVVLLMSKRIWGNADDTVWLVGVTAVFGLIIYAVGLLTRPFA